MSENVHMLPSRPPKLAIGHVRAQPVLVHFQAETGTLRNCNTLLRTTGRFPCGHLFFIAAKLAERVLHFEEILNRAP